MTPQKWGFLGQIRFWGLKKVFWGPPKRKKLIFSKNWTYVIWLHTLGDSHNTQLQGPTNRFSGQFIYLRICFQLGVISNAQFLIPSVIGLTNTFWGTQYVMVPHMIESRVVLH